MLIKKCFPIVDQCLILNDRLFREMKKSKPVTSQGNNNIKPSPKKHLRLMDIFQDQQYLGWQVLDTESKIYSEMQVNMQKIMYLTSLYMKIIERLNSVQDPRQPYFTLKMQKLMSEPYIIRCFNNSYDHKSSTLENRRKQIEQRIEKETERQNHKTVLEQALLAQQQKQKKMIKKLKDHFDQSEKHLDQRIKRRNQMRENRSGILSPRRGTSEAESNSEGMMSASPDSRARSEISIENQFDLSFEQDSISGLKRQEWGEDIKQAPNIVKGQERQDQKQR